MKYSLDEYYYERRILILKILHTKHEFYKLGLSEKARLERLISQSSVKEAMASLKILRVRYIEQSDRYKQFLTDIASLEGRIR